MKKPPETALKLYALGAIIGIKVDYRQTGVAGAETLCTIYGEQESIGGKWSTYRDYLNVGVDYNSVAQVRSDVFKRIREWEAFEKENLKELQEYERLKAKFDS